ncbi:LacI family DNA-binding transcriptional regulator [Nocardioides sp. NPDC058538]|uniref:LacI family DNA-binding transcriptional regulator n=1 Tax=Nocardioides sp. NPDC058538 TaxID=3346542 RepID=UPI0036478A4A
MTNGGEMPPSEAGPRARKPRRAADRPKRRARVTLADVAAEAGVSVGAAGFVISGRDDMRISATTQERVREAARKLNYRPNRAAQALRTGKTGTVGFVSDTIGSTPFGGAAIRGALDVARERHKTLFAAETLGDESIEREVIENLRTRDVDGLVYASMVTREATLPATVQDTPTVLMNTIVPGSRTTTFVPDDHQGGHDAARTLIELGHRDILVLGEYADSLDRPYALDVRLGGIWEAFEEAALTHRPMVQEVNGPDPEDGRRAMADYLADNGNPEAVIALNDRLAFGALQTLGDRVRPGVDFSVISFDNSDLAHWLVPALASLQLPYYEMGRRAMTSLLDGDLESGLTMLPMTLARHDSLRPMG